MGDARPELRSQFASTLYAAAAETAEERDIVVPRTITDKSPCLVPCLRSQPVGFEAAAPQRLNLDHIINPHVEENKRISQEVFDMRDRLKAFNQELRALEDERRLLLQSAPDPARVDQLRAEMHQRVMTDRRPAEAHHPSVGGESAPRRVTSRTVFHAVAGAQPPEYSRSGPQAGTKAPPASNRAVQGTDDFFTF